MLADVAEGDTGCEQPAMASESATLTTTAMGDLVQTAIGDLAQTAIGDLVQTSIGDLVSW